MTRTWAARIKEARVKGYFTFIDVLDSALWTRGPVGERADWDDDPHLPESDDGDKDTEGDAITVLGRLFCTAVSYNRIDEADRLLKSIHRVMRGEDP